MNPVSYTGDKYLAKLLDIEQYSKKVMGRCTEFYLMFKGKGGILG